MISVFIFGMIILKKYDKKNLKLKILSFLIVNIITALAFLYMQGMVKTIIFVISYTIVFKCNFRISTGKSIFVSVLYSILSMIADLITIGMSIFVFNVSKEYYYYHLAGGIICNISVASWIILLTIIFSKPLNKLINYNVSTNKKIILVSCSTLISIGIFFYSLIKTFEFNNNIISYLIIIITLLVVLLLLFKQKIDNEIVLKKYDELLDVMKTYESDIEEQRTLIHETKNELMTIKCKITDKEKEKIIIQYIDSIIGDKQTENMNKYSKFKYLPSNGLRGFFYYKFNEAEKKGINVSVNISNQIEKSFIGKLETNSFKNLVRIIGVYLDNAIEASSISEDKKLGIEIYLINNDAKIIITNTFINDIDQEKIGKERFSTKGKTRGHGLLLVKRILSDNNIFETNKKITEKLYIQELTVKNTNKKVSKK